MFIKYGKLQSFGIFGACIWLLTNGSFASADGIGIKFWKESHSVGLQPYQSAVIMAALETSKKKYGTYSLKIESMLLSSQRSKIEAQRGDLINVMFSSDWSGALAEQSKVLTIHYPFLKSMLGFRSCIVRKSSLERYAKIKTLPEALELVLVQGRDWQDADVLVEGGFTVRKVIGMENMLSMVERGRVDCFPLSVLEVDGYLERYQDKFPSLTIAPDFYLYYPLLVYLAVSSSEPLLYQRVNHGVTSIKNSGKLDKIFREYYGSKMFDVKQKGIRLFIFNNPAYTNQENKKIIDRFLGQK